MLKDKRKKEGKNKRKWRGSLTEWNRKGTQGRYAVNQELKGLIDIGLEECRDWVIKQGDG